MKYDGYSLKVLITNLRYLKYLKLPILTRFEEHTGVSATPRAKGVSFRSQLEAMNW